MQGGKLNTLGCFLFFRLLVYWTWAENLWTFQMPQLLEKTCNFTLRWLLDMGNTSLEQNLRLKTLDYLLLSLLFFYLFLAAPWLTFGYYWGNSLTHLMIIAFGLLIFAPKVTHRGWVSTPNWVPSGLWLQWLNSLTQSPPNCTKYSPQTWT